MTAKKIVLATLGAALVAGAALPAFAAPERGGPDRRGAVMQDVMFVRLLKNADADKDGKVSKDEMTARQDALFTEIDANKDGTITRGELFDYRQAKREEFRKNNPAPQQADNDDQQDRRADRRDDDRRDHDRHGWNHRGHHDRDRREARFDGPRHGGMMRGGFFRMVDEDRDGKITKAEASAAGDRLFARMDTNKDGTISIDDLPDRPL
ncbi:EF-hand domain-containing protein [Neorhizobium sp. DT-125]|uniref:EF-hand domain-containing protein n=1 Tax=Neorhizobium sp. DT-125 TaxID=3396163 RepID=UPI003F1DBEA7